MTVFGTPEQITSVGEGQLLDALDSKYDTLRDKLLSEALMREIGAAEWQALSEQERQARLVKMKLEERRLRREGKDCFIHILEMTGKNKLELPSEKKWQVKFYRYISFHLLTTTHIY
jgi:hypothetical protein